MFYTALYGCGYTALWRQLYGGYYESYSTALECLLFIDGLCCSSHACAIWPSAELPTDASIVSEYNCA